MKRKTKKDVTPEWLETLSEPLLSVIKKLGKETPNDMDFGKEVRKLIK